MTPYNDDEDEGILSGYGSVVSGSHEDVYAKYTKILGEDNPALPMIGSYLARQPNREKLRPTGASKWQNIAMGFAEGLGTYDVYSGKSDPMAGYKTTKQLTDQPYLEARKDWADEAKQVDMMASLADKQHSDKLRSAQWDVSEELRRQKENRMAETALKKAEETHAENIRRDEDRDETRRLANEDRDAARGDRKDNQKALLGLQRDNLELRKDVLKDRQDNRPEKLDPYEKLRIENYKDLTKPIDASKKKDDLIARNPQLGYAFKKMEKGEELTAKEKELLDEYSLEMNKPDDRLLKSLRFGE